MTRDVASISLRKQKVHKKRHPWLTGFLALYFLLLALITFINLIGPDRWWWSGLNLYLPQFIWGIPGILLIPFTLRHAWKWSWAPLLGILWTAGPLMGFCWPVPPPSPPIPGKTLRIMTYNIKYGREIPKVNQQILNISPDLVQMQDGGPGLLPWMTEALKGYYVRSAGQYIIASRYPISEPSFNTVSSRDHAFSTFSYMRCELSFAGEKIPIYDLHLLSPRFGLNAVRHYKDSAGIDDLEGNIFSRVEQANAMAEVLRRQNGPFILTGDLNAPVNSLVCRAFFKVGLHDAYSEAGRGYGYTYGHSLRFHRNFMRIDHIMLSKEWRAISCHVGQDEGSAHCPVFSEVTLQD